MICGKKLNTFACPRIANKILCGAKVNLNIPVQATSEELLCQGNLNNLHKFSQEDSSNHIPELLLYFASSKIQVNFKVPPG